MLDIDFINTLPFLHRTLKKKKTTTTLSEEPTDSSVIRVVGVSIFIRGTKDQLVATRECQWGCYRSKELQRNIREGATRRRMLAEHDGEAPKVRPVNLHF